MGTGEILAGHNLIFLNINSDRGNNVQSFLGLLGVEMALIISAFASLSLLYYVIN